MLSTLPGETLELIANQGTKTRWGKLFDSYDPCEEEDNIYCRLKEKYPSRVVSAYLLVGPMLAEYEAINRAREKNMMALWGIPEVLDIDEAVELATMEKRLDDKEREKLRYLLKNDILMEKI